MPTELLHQAKLFKRTETSAQEEIFARLWAKANLPGGVAYRWWKEAAITHFSQQDAENCAGLIQWLGTNCGYGFLHQVGVIGLSVCKLPSLAVALATTWREGNNLKPPNSQRFHITHSALGRLMHHTEWKALDKLIDWLAGESGQQFFRLVLTEMEDKILPEADVESAEQKGIIVMSKDRYRMWQLVLAPFLATELSEVP